MKKKSVIVIPIWKESITEFESISLRQCCFIFKDYTFCIVTYSDLNLEKIILFLKNIGVSFKILFFKKNYFLNVERYSKLMLSVLFYSRFIFYEYILIYQLDCFAFRDELDAWIKTGYSYIGAPWMDGYDSAKSNTVIGVGNGGFSLRKISDHLRVLLSFSRIDKNNSCNEKIIKRELSNNTFFLFNNFQLNEDVFWSDIAGKNFPWFKIPDWRIAAQFSVEVQPQYFFELNNHTLPFGCHAWWRYDLEFWKPHIEKFGYKL